MSIVASVAAHPLAHRLREWCDEQQTAALSQHAWIPDFVARTRSRQRLILALIALPVCFGVLATGSHGDADAFAAAGVRLLHGNFLIFRDSYLQVGPLWLLLVGLGSQAAGALGAPTWSGGSLLLWPLVTALTVAAGRSITQPPGQPPRELLSGLWLLLGGVVAVPASYGHIEEIIVALLLVVATREAVLGRSVRAGGLLGCAVTIKLWAVVAVGLLLVGASRRLLTRGGLAFVLVTLGAYAPFVAAGHMATFSFVWRVQSPAPVSLLLSDGGSFGYQQRIAQVLVASVVGCLVALVVDREQIAWALPLAVISLRLLADPLPSPYYWSSLVMLLLLAGLSLQVTFLERLLAAFVVDVVALALITTAVGRPGAIQLSLLGLIGLAPVLSVATSSMKAETREKEPTSRSYLRAGR